jgi:AraC-like DNA-binding protein
MSARSVARLFQREVGMSYGQWRARARVMLSQQCLADGKPILNVALEHGYQSASAFTAMFKRILGHAPSDWQNGTAREH